MQILLNKLLCVDIETVSQESSFQSLSDVEKALFSEKTKRMQREDNAVEDLYAKAGIWAEFGKIVCVSFGYWSEREGQFKLKSIYGRDERLLLEECITLLSSFAHYSLAGHNIKEFDIPVLCRRILIHRLQLPVLLQVAGKKPWEITHLDTLELWKFGDFKHYTSLKLLTHVLGIPSPKEDIDGSQVSPLYWEETEEGLERIARYCERDVVAVAQVLRVMGGGEIMRDEEISYTLI